MPPPATSSPPPSTADEAWLAHALDLAEDARAFASPNPAVGCTLVRDGRLLAGGAHRYDARDHAEIVALHAAAATGQSVRNATAYVTLEPCAHHGRTGPCADALIRAGIARAVIATVDPNPQVAGQGLQRMQRAGIHIDLLPTTHPLTQRARRLNDAFAYSIQHRRPFVTLKAALSVDGRLAPPPAHRTATQPHWLTGPAARANVQLLRHQTDALLTGIGTVLADDPSLTDRTGLPRRRPLLRIILDSQLRTPPTSRILLQTQPKKPDTILVCVDTADPGRADTLRDRGAEILPLPADANGRPSLHDLLAELDRRRILSVLAEGGAALNAALLAQALADRLVLYFAETELGSAAVPFAVDGPSPFDLLTRMTSLERTSFPQLHGEDVRLVGYLHDPWETLSSITHAT